MTKTKDDGYNSYFAVLSGLALLYGLGWLFLIGEVVIRCGTRLNRYHDMLLVHVNRLAK